MGYDLHITRADDWSDNQDQWISADEWLEYIKLDSELTLVPEQGEYYAEWSGTSEYDEPWFDWYNGNIETKNPDPPVIQKMIEIAIALNAKVQGDDGEMYPDDVPDFMNQTYSQETHITPPRKPWWRKLFGG